MPVYEFDGKRPTIGEGTWIAPGAHVVGDARIGKNCYIGFGAVIRADFGQITIGEGTLVEDNVVIHTGTRAEIGSKVVIGHLAMVHDVVIKDRVLIGMLSMVCNGATINEWSIVAENSMVKKNQTIASNKIYAGSPAREIGDLKERHKEYLVTGQQAYMDLKARYQNTLKRID